MARIFILTPLLLALAAQNAFAINPVTRVVELMEGLIKKIESDGKAEEELFENYVCWYKTVTSAKKTTNAEAGDRINSLTAYIDDIKSGRIEFTNERGDLEAEVAKLNTEIETATAMRKHENEDFLAAKDEMEKAITAMTRAVEVLGSATSASALTSVGFDIRKAVDLGRNFLNKDDAKLLETILDGGDAPDWHKLNKQATFKKTYKARSMKIQELLSDMLQTFQDNLADAEKKETDSKATFETLISSKESQLSASTEALSAGEAEGTSRTLAKDEAQMEMDALKEQVKTDEGYITSVEGSMKGKIVEWKERKTLRSEEIESISKAIEVLRSDDARDIISSSMKSQTGFFLQTAGCSAKKRGTKVMKKLLAMSTEHKDPRLSMLAVKIHLTAGGKFDKVIAEVMKMVSELHEEADEDLRTKETCEQDRMDNTKGAKKAAQAMDDETAIINRKKADLEAFNKEIAGIVAHIKELNLQLEEAMIQRRKESLEYDQAKSTDEAASVLIGKAKDVLAKFYEDKLSLAQTRYHRQPAVAAGEAPPPPPPTFSEPYGGSKGENNGIQSLLEMIKSDIEKDIRIATEEETKAKAEYAAFKLETENLIEELNQEKAELDGRVGDAESAVAEAKKERADKKQTLDNTMVFLRSIASGCDYIAVNFELRKANREAEIDGLCEAGTSLSGGKLSKAELGAGGFIQKEKIAELVEEEC
jgi:hypothetical protein